MRRTAARQGVRMLKFMDVFGRWEASELSHLEAAEFLGMGERTFRRWCRRYEEEGEAGLLDRRLGEASAKRGPGDEAGGGERVHPQRDEGGSGAAGRRYGEGYGGGSGSHFHERLVAEHGFGWGYTWTKTFLQSRGLLPRAKRRGAHRRKGPRPPLPGMILHQGGSRHVWLAGAPACDLIVTLDDATGEIYSAFLVEE